MAFADFAGGIKICHMYAQEAVSVSVAVAVAVPVRESTDIAYIIFGHDRHLSNSRFWQCQRLFDYVEAFALFSKNSFILYIFFVFCFYFVFILVRFGLKLPCLAAWSHCRRRHHHFLCGNCH